MNYLYIILIIFFICLYFFIPSKQNKLYQKQVMIFMMECCKKGNLEELKKLFENKKANKEIQISIDIYDSQEQFPFVPGDLSPLMYACGFGHTHIIEYILSSKKFLKLERSRQVYIVNTLYAHSALYNQPELVSYFLNSSVLPLNAQINYDNHCALKVACRCGHEKIVHFLLKSNYSINKDILMECILLCFKNNFLDIAKFILEDHRLINIKNEDISSLFLNSLKYHKINISEYLLSHPKIMINQQLQETVVFISGYKLVEPPFIEQILILIKSKLLYDYLHSSLPISSNSSHRLKL